MQPQRIRKILNGLLVLFFLLAGFSSVMCIGGGGVLNDMDEILGEIQDLENRSLLNNLPESVSLRTRQELQYFRDSKGVKEYIHKTGEWLSKMEYLFFVSLVLWFLCLGARIYYRKQKDPLLV